MQIIYKYGNYWVVSFINVAVSNIDYDIFISQIYQSSVYVPVPAQSINLCGG